MKHAEVVIARQAVEEGRGLVVIVNKMDLLRGRNNLLERVMQAVPEEIQTVIPEVCDSFLHLLCSSSWYSYVTEMVFMQPLFTRFRPSIRVIQQNIVVVYFGFFIYNIKENKKT